MSDHGMTKLNSKIYLNQYLEEKGYLSIKTKHRIMRKDLAILPTFVIGNILSKINILDFVYNTIKKSGIASFIGNGTGIQIDYNRIKWEDKTAFCLSDVYGLIYTSSSENGQKINKLIWDLKLLKDPTTGEFVFKEILNQGDVYKYINDETPKLIAVSSEGYHISSSLSGTKIFDHSYKPWSATHRQDGIFLAFGKDINKSKKINCRIYDLAPTILHILNVSIPNDMRGRVLKEIYIEDSKLYNRKINYETVEKKRISSKIKKLKSVGKL